MAATVWGLMGPRLGSDFVLLPTVGGRQVVYVAIGLSKRKIGRAVGFA